MPKAKNTDKPITASDTPRQPKRMGKKEPLTDTLDWKKPFEAWKNGKSDDVYSPILEVLGKLDEKQTAALIDYGGKAACDSAGYPLILLEAAGFDPTKPTVQITEEQFQVICNAIVFGSETENEFAILVLAASEPPAKTENGKLLEPSERKFQFLSNPVIYEDSYHAIDLMEALSGRDTERARILSKELIDFLESQVPRLRSGNQDRAGENVISQAVIALGNLGNKAAVPILKKLTEIPEWSEGDFMEETVMALGRLGFRMDLNAIQRESEAAEREAEMLQLFDREDQRAVCIFISKNRDIKQIVLEGSKILEALPNPQAWITVNEPALAKEAVRLVSEKLGSKIQKFDNALSQSLGVRAKQLTEQHFKFYADEILDAAIQVSAMKELKEDPEFSALLSKAKYSNGIKLRFTRREKSDLSLGDKCGDCTAKGSINFGNSITWYINPAYNVLKMSQGRHFIGKINFTLGKIAGEEAIIIDALEFNPQAKEGKPLHDDALECFEKAIEFLREIAARQNRALFALTFSNSGGASELLRSKGNFPVFVEGEGLKFLTPEEAEKISDEIGIRSTGNEPVAINLFVPSDDVSRVLARGGFKGKPKLFYQMLDTTQAINLKEGKDRMDEKHPILEREVLNPAQIENPEIAKAMRERDFETAAKLIFAEDALLAKVKEIFKLSPNMKLSSAFLVPRMKKIYAADAWEMENLNKTFMVNIENFVKL